MNPDTDNSDNCSVQPFKKWKKEESSPGKSNGNGCSQTEIHSLPTEVRQIYFFWSRPILHSPKKTMEIKDMI